MGFVFVGDDYRDQIRQMTEKLFKMFKTVKYDIDWVRIFMHMVTDPDYDIDPRLQKVLLQKIESMYLE